MKSILVSLLQFLAKRILRKHKPKIVGITGSVGKTSTKEAVFCVLKNKFRTRASSSSYNNELGLPLTIIDSPAPGKNLFSWISIFIKAFGLLVSKVYPQVLVLEMGADRVGDIKKLLEVTGPIDVAVITDIGISHLENYPNPQSLITEKLSILSGLKPDGVAVLNADNKNISESMGKIRASKINYGFTDGLDLEAIDFLPFRNNDSFGVEFKVRHGGELVDFHIYDCLGQPTTYAALAATGVGIALGLRVKDAAEALKSYQGPAGRLKMIAGIKRTWIIDDTYNAAPASTLAALTVLDQLSAGRKVAVLGDMAELGSLSEDGHQQIGVKLQEINADLVFLVGEKTKGTKNELEKRGFGGPIFWFETSDAARMTVQNKIMEGDTILVKGSQSARMEKIVKEIMADPMSAENLLVRQTGVWRDQ